MGDRLKDALDALLYNGTPDNTAEAWQKRAILEDMLWKAVRQDWHGVSDAANDLRELHL